MEIIDHGDWTPYKPNPFPKEAPPNALFCSNQSGVDWYTYSRTNFKDDTTIKMTVMMNPDGKTGIVMAASKDVSFLFPQHLKVIEVSGLTSTDPQAEFGRSLYDSVKKTFTPSNVPVFALDKVTHQPPPPQVFEPKIDHSESVANVTIGRF